MSNYCKKIKIKFEKLKDKTIFHQLLVVFSVCIIILFGFTGCEKNRNPLKNNTLISFVNPDIGLQHLFFCNSEFREVSSYTVGDTVYIGADAFSQTAVNVHTIKVKILSDFGDYELLTLTDDIPVYTIAEIKFFGSKPGIPTVGREGVYINNGILEINPKGEFITALFTSRGGKIITSSVKIEP